MVAPSRTRRGMLTIISRLDTILRGNNVFASFSSAAIATLRSKRKSEVLSGTRTGVSVQRPTAFSTTCRDRQHDYFLYGPVSHFASTSYLETSKFASAQITTTIRSPHHDTAYDICGVCSTRVVERFACTPSMACTAMHSQTVHLHGTHRQLRTSGETRMDLR